MTNRRSNQDEQWAEEWLKSLGYDDIRRLSCDPPDYDVDGRYAVEVTRLNQRIEVGKSRKQQGEENSRKSLRRYIKKVLNRLGSPGNEGRSWVVDCEYDFLKSLPKEKMLETQIREVLWPLTKPYDEAVIKEIHSKGIVYDKHADEISWLNFPHICLPCGICLELTEISHSPSTFILQNLSNGEGVGIAEELSKGIRHRIQDKSKKIQRQNIIDEYEEWWLVLVDHVCHLPIQVLSQDEQSFVRDQNFDFWSRVVIISSKNLDWHYELFPGDADSQ